MIKNRLFLAKEFHTAFNLDAIDYQTANSQFETGSTVRSIISWWNRFAYCCWFWNLQHIEYDDLRKWIVLPFLKLLVFR
jgi:hypothetical protein